MIIQKQTRAGEYHVARDEPYLDTNLSWEARGVLAYLFSKPEDWTPRMYDIVENGPCEKYKIKGVFKELEEHGYLDREKFRTNDGTYDWKVTVADHPRFHPGWRESTPDGVHPGSDRGSNNTELQSGTDKQSERKKTTTAAPADAPPPAHEETPDPFTVEQDDVDAITAEAFGTPIRGLSIKDQIEQKCEDNAPEGWDCLRAVCQTIIDKGWSPSAALVKTRLEQQIQMINETHDEEEQDDFAAKAQSIFEAAGRGAGVHE
jgi:hypothetical protein